MTKRDYLLIARVIQDANLDWEGRKALSFAFAWAIHEHGNRRFNIEKFINACMSPKIQMEIKTQ